MAEHNKKSHAIENVLSKILGSQDCRIVSIQNDVCVPAPIGCGKPAESFDNALSAREFKMSGLCQSCQDNFFGVDENE